MMEWLDEGAELLAVVVGIWLALSMLSRRNERWATGFSQRKFAVLLLVAAAVVLIEVTAEVLDHDSTALDRALLLSIHRDVPAALLPLFSAATRSGSAAFLVPVVAIACVLLAWWRHVFDALALLLTTGVASLVVYLAKTSVGRDRPELWTTNWYWGSSFPSGHTLSTAAIATAAYFCTVRLRPQWRRPAFAIAFGWVAMVALSRLVLGVHWPTDVLAAACAGLLLAVMVNVALLRVRGMEAKP
jgi:undecaprenyl-diphosphatase